MQTHDAATFNAFPPLPNDMPQQPFEVPASAPPGVYPRFFMEARRVPDKKSSTGFRFTHVELVELLIAGDSKTKVIRKVTPNLRQMYANAYALFKRGQQAEVNGYPVDIWPVVQGRPALVNMLKMNNIFTVEALADIGDGLLQNLGLEGRDLRTKAQATIEAAKADAPFEKLRLEGEEKDRKLALQADQIAQLTEAVSGLQAAQAEPKRGPGRPPKQAKADAE